MTCAKEHGRAIAAAIAAAIAVAIAVAAPSVDLDLAHAVVAEVLGDQYGVDQVMLGFNDPGPLPPPPARAPTRMM